MKVKVLATTILSLSLFCGIQAHGATSYANSLSRGNCTVPLSILYHGNLYFPTSDLENPIRRAGVTFNESVSWNPFALILRNRLHRVQVHSIQERIVSRRGRWYFTENENYYSPNYIHNLGNWSYQWNAVPLTWRSYAGQVRSSVTAPRYKMIYGMHDERLDSGTTRKAYTSAEDCNLTQW